MHRDGFMHGLCKLPWFALKGVPIALNEIMHRAKCNAHRANGNQVQTLRIYSNTTGSSAARCIGQQVQTMRTMQQCNLQMHMQITTKMEGIPTSPPRS
jgi:hypothetical protein